MQFAPPAFYDGLGVPEISGIDDWKTLCNLHQFAARRRQIAPPAFYDEWAFPKNQASMSGKVSAIYDEWAFPMAEPFEKGSAASGLNLNRT